MQESVIVNQGKNSQVVRGWEGGEGFAMELQLLSCLHYNCQKTIPPLQTFCQDLHTNSATNSHMNHTQSSSSASSEHTSLHISQRTVSSSSAEEVLCLAL